MSTLFEKISLGIAMLGGIVGDGVSAENQLQNIPNIERDITATYHQCVDVVRKGMPRKSWVKDKWFQVMVRHTIPEMINRASQKSCEFSDCGDKVWNNDYAPIGFSLEEFFFTEKYTGASYYDFFGKAPQFYKNLFAEVNLSGNNFQNFFNHEVFGRYLFSNGFHDNFMAFTLKNYLAACLWNHFEIYDKSQTNAIFSDDGVDALGRKLKSFFFEKYENPDEDWHRDCRVHEKLDEAVKNVKIIMNDLKLYDFLHSLSQTLQNGSQLPMVMKKEKGGCVVLKTPEEWQVKPSAEIMDDEIDYGHFGYMLRFVGNNFASFSGNDFYLEGASDSALADMLEAHKKIYGQVKFRDAREFLQSFVNSLNKTPNLSKFLDIVKNNKIVVLAKTGDEKLRAMQKLKRLTKASIAFKKSLVSKDEMVVDVHNNGSSLGFLQLRK
ncbi:MAG: hypothetical protein IJ599_05090 [Alphaproteobacteria bacterium]|nr:hypothetical protein [Alphaproteobacteria bacterium]